MLRRPRPAPRSLAATRLRPSSASCPPRASFDPYQGSSCPTETPRRGMVRFANRRLVLRYGSCVERAARCHAATRASRVLPASWCITPVRLCRVRNGIEGGCRRCPIGTPQRRPGGRQRRLWRHRTAAQRSTAGRQRHATGPTICLAACAANPCRDCASGLQLRPVTTALPPLSPRHLRRCHVLKPAAVVTGRVSVTPASVADAGNQFGCDS